MNEEQRLKYDVDLDSYRDAWLPSKIDAVKQGYYPCLKCFENFEKHG